MATVTQNPGLPEPVRQALRAVRLRLRAYVWLHGITLLIVLLGAAFWVGLLFDWWLEPSPAVRRTGMIAVGLLGVYVVYRYILRRAFVPVSDAAAATLLERRFSGLGDHVLTAVHIAHAPTRAAAYHAELVAKTNSAAAQAVAELNAAKLFDRKPLGRSLGGAVVVCLSVVLFAVLWQDAFGFWIKRLSLAEERWPRRVQLEVVGFPATATGQRTQRIAEEDDFELMVRARLDGFEAPRTVEIRSRGADGRRDRDTLIRVGQAVAGRDEFQLYRYEFNRVTADITFDVLGGDDRVSDLRLEVVERPELLAIELECEYPPYLKRPPRRVPVTGGMRIPEGTRLTVLAKSTKPLTSSRIRASQRSEETELAFAAAPTSELRWEYGPLTGDDVLFLTVTDTDGVSSRDPYRVSLAVVPDETPQVAVRLSGIGTSVTPEARIPLAGRITDEYGVKEVWFEFQVDGAPAEMRPLAGITPGALSAPVAHAFDLREIDPATGARALMLAAGQRLALTLKASDEYDLSDEVRSGASPQYRLDIVTLPELLALLERRELELRQRFEAIYEKVGDTRNMLSRVRFDEQSEGTGEPAEGAGEASAREPQSETERSLARRRLRVAGSLQNINQAADETLGVAEAFEEIHEQLTNNRIDNTDLKTRLREHISSPLRRIGETRMPDLAAQVQLIEARLGDAEAGPPAVEAAVAAADAVLIEMNQVLQRMLELETYNELVSQLREFIQDQEELNRRTREIQRQRLRGIFQQDDN